MKNIFLATTALVATAGFAAAEVSFSGGANLGLKYNDAAANKTTVHREITLTVAMTGETDGGLTFGADMTITAGGVGDVITYIEGGFGKLSVGDVDNAVQAVSGLSDIGFDGLGTDDIAEGIRGLSAANALYEGTFGDFTVALSGNIGGADNAAGAGTEDLAIGVKYAMGNYSIGLGYGTYNAASYGGYDLVFADRQNAITVQVGANVGDLALAALYSTTSLSGDASFVNSADATDFGTLTDIEDAKATQMGLTAAYTMGAVTVSAAYSVSSLTDEADVEGYGLGVAYDLGGGASVKAGVGEVGGVTVADLGVTMSF